MRNIDFFNGLLLRVFAIENKHFVSEVETGTDAISEAADSDFLSSIAFSARWTNFPFSHPLNP
jgi:hypothetical protein